MFTKHATKCPQGKDILLRLFSEQNIQVFKLYSSISITCNYYFGYTLFYYYSIFTCLVIFFYQIYNKIAIIKKKTNIKIIGTVIANIV